MTAYRLESFVQHYAWGARSWIADFLGREASGKPEAELWMGAHVKCPSRLEASHAGALESLGLDEWISRDPERHLGRELIERFGDRLPFLFKVLAADRPLSLQVHPSLEAARIGFENEEARGVPKSALHRNYQDASHKPELLCALGRFYAFCGFREPRQALQLLDLFGVADPENPLFPAWRRFRQSPDVSGLRRFFSDLFVLEQEALGQAIERTVRAAELVSAEQAQALLDLPGWIRRLAALHPRDPGVLVGLLLNLVVLEPGQAIFLPAGNLHAYLGGLGLEVMASSDNVLRGGLTEKHVDVQELIRVVDFDPLPSPILEGQILASGHGVRVVRFETHAVEFELRLIELGEGGQWMGQGPQLGLVLEGAVQLTSGASRLELRRGEQVFCAADSPFELRGEGKIACVSVGTSERGMRSLAHQ